MASRPCNDLTWRGCIGRQAACRAAGALRQGAGALARGRKRAGRALRRFRGRGLTPCTLPCTLLLPFSAWCCGWMAGSWAASTLTATWCAPWGPSTHSGEDRPRQGPRPPALGCCAGPRSCSACTGGSPQECRCAAGSLTSTPVWWGAAASYPVHVAPPPPLQERDRWRAGQQRRALAALQVLAGAPACACAGACLG